jgi:nitric oxide reductase large subunit
MAVNILGIGWKITRGNHIVVLLVLIVSLSSFARSEKEPVDADSAKSDNPSSEVCYQAACQYFFWVAAFS